MPFFSIIIPLYNKERHIKATLESVFAQTFQDFEIIIVNDGSTDDSLKVVESIKDERIKLYTISNKGVSFARNFGIEKAASNLIVFLDADDYWYPYHLKHLKKLYINFPNCGLYATAYDSKINNRIIPSEFYKISKKPDWIGIVEDYFESSTINCIAWTSAVMIPKSIFDTIGNFDERITLGAGEDTDLWIRIALKYDVAFCNTVSATHNLQADNRISNSNTNLRQFINLDQYETQAKFNHSLKKYLDLNRYSFALQYKLVGNIEKAKSYINAIDFSNLNKKQRLIIQLNPFCLKIAMKTKQFLQNKGIRLSSFN